MVPPLAGTSVGERERSLPGFRKLDAEVGGLAEGEAVGGDLVPADGGGVEGEGFESVEAGIFGHGAGEVDGDGAGALQRGALGE